MLLVISRWVEDPLLTCDQGWHWHCEANPYFPFHVRPSFHNHTHLLLKSETFHNLYELLLDFPLICWVWVLPVRNFLKLKTKSETLFTFTIYSFICRGDENFTFSCSGCCFICHIILGFMLVLYWPAMIFLKHIFLWFCKPCFSFFVNCIVFKLNYVYLSDFFVNCISQISVSHNF